MKNINTSNVDIFRCEQINEFVYDKINIEKTENNLWK